MAKNDTPKIIRLLVVGDGEALVHIVERLGDSHGEDRFTVRRVAKPSDVEPSDTSAYDALILDLKPIMESGSTKVEGVVVNLAGHGPVIALTGTVDRATEQSLRHAGAADCLFESETTPRALLRSIRYVIATNGSGVKKNLPRLFDPATGLATQFLFWEILALAARRAKRNRDFFALLLVEMADLPIDGNETLTSQVMQIAAERASGVLRASDTVARFEHNQLAVLVESMARVADIQIVAEKLVQEFGRPFPVENQDRQYAVNLGISLFPTSAENAEMLIGKAFEALAHSKSRGKDQFVFA